MPDYLHVAIEALRETAASLITANTAIKRAAETVLAEGERGSAGEAKHGIRYLEGLVMQLAGEIRTLRDRLSQQ